MVKRYLTGANYGLGSWLQQRITAVIMLFTVIAFFAFIAYLSLNVNASISSWQAIFHSTYIRIFVQIFFIALVMHAWVGMRDFWMDYVTSAGVRLFLYVLTILWLISGLIYSIKILWV